MVENIVKNLLEAVDGNIVLIIMVISMIPLIELRGAIPVAIAMDLTFGHALFWAWLGSSIMIIPLLLLLRPILNYMKKFKLFKVVANLIEVMFSSKATQIESKINTKSSNLPYARSENRWKKILALFIFVSLPVPLTGIWTGSAIAAFMEGPIIQSFLAILLGNLVAALLMTTLSFYAAAYVDYIIYGLFVAIVLVVIVNMIFAVKKYMGIKKGEDLDNQ